MAVTLWDHINDQMGGDLKKLLVTWHTKEGVGTPTITKRLKEMGYQVEQRTVWRWLKKEDIARKGAK